MGLLAGGDGADTGTLPYPGQIARFLPCRPPGKGQMFVWESRAESG